MHDASAFRSVQHDARYAADQLAAFIAQAIAADVHPPRLLAEATWELWEFARSPTPAHAGGIPWPSTDPGAEVGEMRRRDFLTGTLAVTGIVLSETLAGMRPVDPEFITRALNTTHAYRQLIHTATARDYLGPLLRHAASMRDLAQQASDGLRAGCLTAYGDATAEAAWIVADGRHSALAGKLAREALDAATDAGNHDLSAYCYGVLGLFTAHQQHDPYGGLRFVGRGMDESKHATAVTRAYVAAVTAELHSLTGSRYRTLASLEQADSHLERADLSDSPSWLRTFVPARVQHYRGACLARVGHARYAATILHDALGRHGQSSNNRALILADLTTAYVRLKEPEQACTMLSRAIESVRDSRSAMRFERLTTARSLLDPWQHESFVRELDEQLTTVAVTL